MDLKDEVIMVMQSRAGHALTVDQVAKTLTENIKSEIRLILNDLVRDGRLTSVHGGGGYITYYKMDTVPRRI